MKFSKIIGTGSSFPENVITNEYLSSIVDTSDEWIVSHTGIKNRHIAAKGELNTDMASKACIQAMDMANVFPEDVDAVVFSTTTPSLIVPCDAAMLQTRLKLPRAFTFDLNAACSGFVYGIVVADSLIKAGTVKTVIVVSAERLSTVTNWKDRNTCILFGDGAGAVVLTCADKPGIYKANLSSDGSLAEHLQFNKDGLIEMQGQQVFKNAVIAITNSAEQAVRDSGLDPSDIVYIVPHQANIRIMEAVAKRLNLNMERVIVNIDRRGNTGSASIPCALDEAVRSGKIKAGDNIVFTAFGGGFTWGSVVVTM